jgi:hypothetical protein
VWHHDLVERIQEVDDQVSEINGKLDALLATSPAASQLFFQIKKSSLPDAGSALIKDRHLKFADVPTGKPEFKWRKITKADDNKRQKYY